MARKDDSRAKPLDKTPPPPPVSREETGAPGKSLAAQLAELQQQEAEHHRDLQERLIAMEALLRQHDFDGLVTPV